MRGRRVAGVLLGLAAAAAAAIAGTVSGCQSFGAHAGGERLARMERSPEWRDGEFRNPQPMWNDMHLALAHGFSGVPDSEPSAPVPVARTDPAVLAGASLRRGARARGRPLRRADGRQAATWLDHRTDGTAPRRPRAFVARCALVGCCADVDRHDVEGADGVDAHRVTLPACPAASVAQAVSER